MMKWLSIIHRWAGAFIGLLLALMGLSGAILVWEGSWINLPGAGDAFTESVVEMAVITDHAAASGDLSRITFASDEIGLHLVTLADGGGAYVRQDGAIVGQWASQWQRPELWIFDFHHHLFTGDTGETVTGIAGIAGILFVVTGLILWWRSRRTFRLRLWPERMKPGPIVKQHRDIGLVAAPLLLLSMVTGVLMLFTPLRDAVIGEEVRPKVERVGPPIRSPGEALVRAKALFPDADLRRITLPKEPSGAISVRLRQPFEWTPNGRTQVTFAPDGTVSIEDAGAANGAAMVSEKFYPLHSAKVGGLAWKLAMTFSGLVLAMLGGLATWSFWKRRFDHRRSRRQKRMMPPIAETPIAAGTLSFERQP